MLSWYIGIFKTRGNFTADELRYRQLIRYLDFRGFFTVARSCVIVFIGFIRYQSHQFTAYYLDFTS